MRTITKPPEEKSPEYFHQYYALLKEEDLFQSLEKSLQSTVQLFSPLPEEKEDYRYAENKWSVKEVLSHLVDTERIFTYRALRCSRRDATPLAGYEENNYAPNCNANARRLKDIIEEYESVRKATFTLYQYMTKDMLDFMGKANDMNVSARNLGWMIAGHNIHHCNIVAERYL